MNPKRLSFFTICFTFFVDYLSWSVVFPIFAPYFLDVNNQIFGSEVSAATRALLLGFFLAAFSLGQFLGAPLIGEYADKYGRKRALLVSVSMTLIGLVMSAYSMGIHNLYLLFAGRLLTGIFSSSTSICLSCASDLSESEREKVKHFGTLSMIGGLAFIVGAFAGGKLSDSTIDASFSANVPLWIASCFTLINFLFIVFGFKETSSIQANVKYHFLESFHHIKIALRTEKIKEFYLAYFLFFTAWILFFQFIPVLAVEKFFYTNSNIGDLALFMGICWAIGSGYLNQYFDRYFSSMGSLEICLIGFSVLCGIVVFPKHIYMVLGIIGLCVIFGSIAWPICTGRISNAAPQHMQGKILGLSQSVQSLAMTLGPLIGALAFQFSLKLPFLVAAGIGCLSVIFYYFLLKER